MVLGSLGFVGPLGEQVFSGAIEVIDGDTFDVGHTRLRLYGVDAPEIGQTCTNAGGAAWDCGTWVRDQVRARFEGQKARCEEVVQDLYGCSVARCTLRGKDMGRVLVQEGLALAHRKYSMAYDLDEKGAVVAGRGLHAHVMARPEEYRRAVRAERVAQKPAPDPACAIKGNISRKGRRIYHMPGQDHYDRTSISTERGERWFCSETNARAAGWRRAKR